MKHRLHKILENKKKEIAIAQSRISESEMRKRAEQTEPPPDFLASFRSVKIGLIAELKYRSPSAGVLRDPFDPVAIAEAYQVAGAQALSVLMDEKFFGGGENQFLKVRQTVSLPLLYKEFVLTSWQVWHARAIGASLILLIAAALDHQSLCFLKEQSEKAGLQVLVEVHNEEEMARACEIEASIIGINNRNLKTFETSLETTFLLKDLAPTECTLISESGIRDARDVKRLYGAGIHGILVGEHLLRQPDLQQAVKALMQGV